MTIYTLLSILGIVAGLIAAALLLKVIVFGKKLSPIEMKLVIIAVILTLAIFLFGLFFPALVGII